MLHHALAEAESWRIKAEAESLRVEAEAAQVDFLAECVREKERVAEDLRGELVRERHRCASLEAAERATRALTEELAAVRAERDALRKSGKEGETERDALRKTIRAVEKDARDAAALEHAGEIASLRRRLEAADALHDERMLATKCEHRSQIILLRRTHEEERRKWNPTPPHREIAVPAEKCADATADPAPAEEDPSDPSALCETIMPVAALVRTPTPTEDVRDRPEERQRAQERWQRQHQALRNMLHQLEGGTDGPT